MPHSIKESEIRESILKAINLLRQTYRIDQEKSEYGWYHYLDDPKPGVTASAVSLFCFHLAGESFERADDVLLYLKQKQVTSEDPKTNGGWPIRTTISQPIVESTSWALQSAIFSNTILNTKVPDVKAGYQWLINNQNTDYGWGSYYGQKSRVFTTSLALIALSSLNKFAPEVSLGADWLLRYQNKDFPAWGILPNEPPTILHTCYAIYALSAIPGKVNQKLLDNTLEWLEEQINPYSFTEVLTQAEDYDIPFTESGKPIVFQTSLPHFSLPIAIYTILKLSSHSISPKISLAVNEIIHAQDEKGFWHLPRSPLRPSIWGVWPFIAALSQAITPRVMQPSTELSIISKSIIVIQPEKAMSSFTSIIIQSTWISIKRFLAKFWIWLIIFSFVLAGLLAVYTKLVGVQEFLLSLFFPIILLILQLLLDRKK